MVGVQESAGPHTRPVIPTPCQVYCLCRSDSRPPMVGCDGPCKGWYHFGCVGLKSSPTGDWCCRSCIQKLKVFSQDPVPAIVQFVTFQVTALRRHLKSVGLSDKGKKADLRQRLLVSVLVVRESRGIPPALIFLRLLSRNQCIHGRGRSSRLVAHSL